MIWVATLGVNLFILLWALPLHFSHACALSWLYSSSVRLILGAGVWQRQSLLLLLVYPVVACLAQLSRLQQEGAPLLLACLSLCAYLYAAARALSPPVVARSESATVRPLT